MGGPSRRPIGMTVGDLEEDIKSFAIKQPKSTVSAEEIVKANSNDVSKWRKLNPIVKNGFSHCFNSTMSAVIGMSFFGDITGVVASVATGFVASVYLWGL